MKLITTNNKHLNQRSNAIDEIETQFNKIFIDLKAVFPAITTVIKTQSDLDAFKKQWLLAFAENGITTLKQFEIGMSKARQQKNPFVPSPGQFISWCQEGTAQNLGLPTVQQVMTEFYKYSREFGYSCQTAEEFEWSYPVMYWIVTDLRKHMYQYRQSEFEIEKRAELLINKWSKKLNDGETIPEIRVQLEDKMSTAHCLSFECDHPLIKKYRERIELARAKRRNNA